jgi:uncharacterized protein (TIGR03435 family)
MLLAAVLAIASALPGASQTAAAPAKSLAFDVVSIKPNKTGSNNMSFMFSDGHFSATGLTLRQLLVYAYALKMDDQVVGLSGSMAEARFDIQAKLDDDAVVAFKKLPREERVEQNRGMVHRMLADRYKLAIHRETKELPLYNLILAKGGTKLKEADPNDTYPNGIKAADGTSRPGMFRMGPGVFTAQAVPIGTLISSLSQQVHRIVTDKTGLTGKYDFALNWTPDDNRSEGQDSGTAANAGISLFTALQEQLGLKLEPAKGPVETIVIDHLELPSEN